MKGDGTWAEEMAGEFISISLTSNQDDKTDLIGTTITITDNTESTTLLNTTWQGTTIEFVIPVPCNYTVSIGDITGYRKTPGNVTYDSRLGRTRNLTWQYDTEVVTVNCSASDGSSVAGQTVTIYNVTYTLDSTGIVIAKVPFGVTYSIVAGTWSDEYKKPANQSFTANQISRTVTVIWTWQPLGVFIEATDGTLYTASTWALAGKTANAVVVLTLTDKVRMALTQTSLTIHSKQNDPLENYITQKDEASAKVDYDGVGNTNKIIQFNIAYGTNTTSYAAPYCKAFSFTFPSGQKGCLPSLGQLWTLYQNKTEVNACLSACGGTAMDNNYYYSSTFWGTSSGGVRCCWVLGWHEGYVGTFGGIMQPNIVRPVSAYK